MCLRVSTLLLLKTIGFRLWKIVGAIYCQHFDVLVFIAAISQLHPTISTKTIEQKKIWNFLVESGDREGHSKRKQATPNVTSDISF